MLSNARKFRMLSLILVVAMLLSTAAMAARQLPEDVVDAKDEFATVDIIQTYNGMDSDGAIHNYYVDGDLVTIDYKAELKMTYEMAWYLQQRQTQLKNAKFNVHINMDMDKLEFTTDKVSVTFKSTFLKPWENREGYAIEFPTAFVNESDYAASQYEVEFLGRDDAGFFSYEITVDADWALSKNSFDVPMELITYYHADRNDAYGYEVASQIGSIKYEPLMYGDFEIEDWMQPITLSVANMKVRDSVRESVTFDPVTWTYVEADGTVDGEFSYVPGKCSQIESLKKYGSETTLEFGNGSEDAVMEEWRSDEVYVYLIRQVPVAPGEDPDSPYLNLEDHFAYIIGYPDGMVHPEGTITRAEVATIFFRMLTDEIRNLYWSKVNDFNDVELTDWYNNAISTLANMKIIDGYPDGSFRPNGNITRAEFATMAVRFFIITEDYGTYEGDAFSDIANHWANEYINLAYLLEIVNGYPDGTYRPQNAITRAEAMTIVNNTLRRTPCNPGIEPVEDHEDFIAWPDNMNKNMWYYAAVQEATNSHDYVHFTEPKELVGKELWLDILPVRDWAAFERAWSDANSAANPGEVVDGK